MLQQPDFRISGLLWFPGPDFVFRAISGPAPGPYFIRALSRGEQLESKNERYFFIGVSRVDYENKIFKRKFLFSGRVLVSVSPKGGPLREVSNSDPKIKDTFSWPFFAWNPKKSEV